MSSYRLKKINNRNDLRQAITELDRLMGLEQPTTQDKTIIGLLAEKINEYERQLFFY